MQFRFLCSAAIALTAVALGASTADVWSKDSKEWSGSDVHKILTASPWAEHASATISSAAHGGDDSYPGSGAGRVPQGVGGTRYPGGIGGGVGGGIGGGIGGAGRGGTGYPGGGNRGGGAGRGRQRVETQEKMDLIVRWESALPIKQAQFKLAFGEHPPLPGDANYTLDKPDSAYVVSLVGLRMPRQGADNGSGTNPDEHRRNVLIASTQLLIRNKSAINPDDCKIEPQTDGTETAIFFFPRTEAIDLDDREVTFITQTGSMKVERKFRLKEMVYNGKLSL